ncbi:MAG: NAD-dependent epimerase/dehydratase family protein [Alphaproteobacteria bacterium]
MNLVTGGGGFLGAHLISLLLAEGQDVRVLEKPGACLDHLPIDRIDVVEADIRDATAVRPTVRGCDRVYHLAADPNLWHRDRRSFDAVNHQGTVNVMRAAVDAGITEILYTSTESILAPPPSKENAHNRLDLDESDMPGPYCVSKFRAERAVHAMVADGAQIVIVTPTLPVGPGDWKRTPPTRMTVAFCRGEMPAFLECRLNFMDARDVAWGMVLAMEKGRKGARYVLGDTNLYLSEWLRLVGEEVGRAVPRWRVPYAVALGTAYISEFWADYISHSMPMATVTGVRLTRRNMFFDTAPDLAELGLQPRCIRESVRDSIAWYRAQGWL